ncbi:MAG: hypothetical protein ABI591_08280 [Kofleriaceae bacterium]
MARSKDPPPKSDDKPNDKPNDKPKDKTDDETAPVMIKKAGGDETAPVDPAAVAKLVRASSSLGDSFDEPTVVPPHPSTLGDADATPPPMKPVGRTETVEMPVVDHGRPPEMPTTSAPPPLALGDVEDPTHMPGPRDIPGGEPDDRAPAPGRVPPGDSRSLRRPSDFALIYRVGTYVISRFGRVGTRGQWRVVEYPTSSSASHSYAKECSRFVSEGFSDYRD